LLSNSIKVAGIFKGFDGERVIGPAKIYLKPYWKERSTSYFQEEGQ